MLVAMRFAARDDLLRWACAAAPTACAEHGAVPLVCEFGVYVGTTIRVLAGARPHVHGFDCWAGLPEDWRPGFPRGMFALGARPDVPANVTLVDGLFASSLPAFFAAAPPPGMCRHVALAHVDCDLYSSTRDVLDAIAPWLCDGAIVVFDEYQNYPGAEAHERRAFEELLARGEHVATWLADVHGDEQVAFRVSRGRAGAVSAAVPAGAPAIAAGDAAPVVKAVILTLDSLPNLRRQLDILRADPLVAEIVVVDNGSEDGTSAWLASQADVTAIRRTHRAPGPGRNAGLDAAGRFDHVLTLDGGVLPLVGGVRAMLDYLERRRDAHVIGVEIPDMVTDEAVAHLAWPRPVTDADTYHNLMMSYTAYALARAAAFDGIRFAEHGPFGETGWGVDDNELAFRWNARGIAVHVVRGVHAYRRPAGSFERLYRETGVWPNQFGSVYEQRLVYCQQEWPQYRLGVQQGEPWLTLLVDVTTDDVAASARLIQRAHDRLRDRAWFHPYSIVACGPPEHGFFAWAEPRRLRQHHGDTLVVDGRVVRRTAADDTWTGDIRIWHGRPEDAVRPDARAWARVRDADELARVLDTYAPVLAAAVPPPRGPLVTR